MAILWWIRQHSKQVFSQTREAVERSHGPRPILAPKGACVFILVTTAKHVPAFASCLTHAGFPEVPTPIRSTSAPHLPGEKWVRFARRDVLKGCFKGRMRFGQDWSSTGSFGRDMGVTPQISDVLVGTQVSSNFGCGFHFQKLSQQATRLRGAVLWAKPTPGELSCRFSFLELTLQRHARRPEENTQASRLQSQRERRPRLPFLDCNGFCFCDKEPLFDRISYAAGTWKWILFYTAHFPVIPSPFRMVSTKQSF